MASADAIDGDTIDSWIERLVTGELLPDFQDTFQLRPTDFGQINILLKDYFGACDSRIKALLAKPEYATTPDSSAMVRAIATEAFLILKEPTNYINLLNCVFFGRYCDSNLNSTAYTVLNNSGLIGDSSASPPPQAKSNNKRKAETSLDDIIPLKNRFNGIEQEKNLDDEAMEQNSTELNTENAESTIPGPPREIIHPFYVEFGDIDWNTLTKKLKSISPDTPPAVKLAGEFLLKVQCKNTDSFRAIQNYLDTEGSKYTTIPPKEQRPKKLVIRGIPPNTRPELVIEELKNLGYTCTRASMMKSRKTGKGMPMYMVNVLPCKNFENIYKIVLLCDIDVTVESFRNTNNVKQCYRCQQYGHASEICKLTPKCVKCAGSHFTAECPTVGVIPNPKCANCGLAHPATYRGCSRNPRNINKKNSPAKKETPSTLPVKQKTNTNNNDLSALADILKNFNYAKKSDFPALPSKNMDSNVQTKQNETPTADASTPVLPSTSNNDSTSTPTPPPQENYVNGFNDIFTICKDVKELLQITKLLKCIKTIAEKSNKCTNPFEKMFILIQEFDNLATELNLTSHE